MRIDAHQHFWKYNPERYAWIDDSMANIRRDFQPEHLAPVLKANHMDGSVVVEAHPSEDETHNLLNLADKNPFIKGVVGWVDLLNPAVNKRLEYFSTFPKFKGVRHAVQSEPDINFMLREDFQRGLSYLKNYNLVYEILIFPPYLSAAIQCVKNHPQQKFVLNHLAKPYIQDRKLEPWTSKIKELAGYSNVFCKLSGLVTEADIKNWKGDDFKPYLDIVINSFGTSRVMFGSDWPVCLLGATYEQVKTIIENFILMFDAEEKEKIMGLNALQFYNINI